MGVTGLWTLLEPVSKPVPLETLENKTLAVDVSIWLHQATKGFRDAQGNPLPNAHLLGLCHRICKLLFYKIKPVFIFDGGVPFLKRQTITARQTRKSASQKNSERAAEKILKNYLKSEFLNFALNKNKKVPRVKKQTEKDMFELPPLPAPLNEESEDSESGVNSSDMDDAISSHIQGQNIHSVDVNSEAFRSLPPEQQHEILLELKETRKQNSWNKIHEMPDEAQDFSGFQMQRLLKRRNVQVRLDEVAKEMNQNSHNFLGLDLDDNRVTETRRIDSDNTTRYVLIKTTDPKTPSKSQTDVITTSETKEVIKLDDDDDLTQEELLAIMSSEKKVVEMFESSDSDLEEVPAPKPFLSVAITKDWQYQESDDIFADVFRSAGPVVESPVVQEMSSSDTESSDDDQSEPPPCVEKKIEEPSREPAASKTPIEEPVWPNFAEESPENVASPSVVEVIEVKTPFSRKVNQEAFVVQAVDGKAAVDHHKEDVAHDVFVEEADVVHESSEEGPELLQEVCKKVEETGKERPQAAEQHVPGPTRAELEAMSSSLDREQLLLIQQHGREQRLATSITDQMYLEAQELLRLFGIPYLVAPMEAEAQCAFLDQADLTDGTITDDSDVWLFGGRRVYKNFFNQGKYVEFFQADEIKRVFRLEREQLIQMALLTGSDYTEGVETVGPVTALEILAEFPNSDQQDGLERFRDWLYRVQSRKDAPPENKIRQKIRHLKLSAGFPNRSVVDAYLRPEVNDSRARFTWASPDMDALRDYLFEKIGWNRDKFNSVVVPVLERFNCRNTQMRIDSFFARFPAKSMTTPNISKRVQNAIQRADFQGDEPESAPPKRKKESPAGGTKRVGTKKNIPVVPSVPVASTSTAGQEEVIWQKERDKQLLEANKQKAIELFRQKATRGRGGRPKRSATGVSRLVTPQAELSESSDSG